MPPLPSLPELAEADAPPEIAAIYRELRRLSAVPMVALIWRHLATLPGVLPEVWAAVGPLFARGLIQEAAWSAAERGVVAPPAGIDRAALGREGLGGADQDAFTTVLAAYNRANPINFVTVRLLVQAMRGGGDRRALPEGAWSPPTAIGALPPMAALAAFSSEQRRLVDALTSSPLVDRDRVVPSLYRHLIGWPGLIALLHADLAPRFETGEIGRLVQGVSADMAAEASRLSPLLPPLPALAARPNVVDVFDRFSALIPEMVVVGLLLARGMERPCE